MRTKCRSIATFHRPIHSHWSLPLTKIDLVLWPKKDRSYTLFTSKKNNEIGRKKQASRNIVFLHQKARMMTPSWLEQCIFVFCRLYPLLHPATTAVFGSIWVLHVISLLLTNIVSLVQACLSIWRERFLGPKMKKIAGLLVFNPPFLLLSVDSCLLNKWYHINKKGTHAVQGYSVHSQSVCVSQRWNSGTAFLVGASRSKLESSQPQVLGSGFLPSFFLFTKCFSRIHW